MIADPLLVETDFQTHDHLFIKHIRIRKRATIVPQHVHNYEHTTFVAAGRVMLVKGERGEPRFEMREFAAPAYIVIEPELPHSFVALEDDTTILCLHNMHDPKFGSLIAKNDASHAKRALGI